MISYCAHCGQSLDTRGQCRICAQPPVTHWTIDGSTIRPCPCPSCARLTAELDAARAVVEGIAQTCATVTAERDEAVRLGIEQSDRAAVAERQRDRALAALREVREVMDDPPTWLVGRIDALLSQERP